MASSYQQGFLFQTDGQRCGDHELRDPLRRPLQPRARILTPAAGKGEELFLGSLDPGPGAFPPWLRPGHFFPILFDHPPLFHFGASLSKSRMAENGRKLPQNRWGVGPSTCQGSKPESAPLVVGWRVPSPRLTWKLPNGPLWKTWFHLQDRPSGSFHVSLRECRLRHIWNLKREKGLQQGFWLLVELLEPRNPPEPANP